MYIRGQGLQIYIRFHEALVVVRHGDAGDRGAGGNQLIVVATSLVTLICGT